MIARVAQSAIPFEIFFANFINCSLKKIILDRIHNLDLNFHAEFVINISFSCFKC